MSEITTYEKTKDSGIEWIGRVPSHWRVHTLYQLVTQVKEKNSNLQEKNLLSLSYGKIKRKDIDSPDGLLPASFDGYNIIEDGDIVLRLTDLQNDHTSLRVGLATERGIITSAYTTLRPIDTSNSKYLYYLLHAFDLKKGFYGMGSGVRQGLNYAEVKELRVVLPGQDEQNAIVRFLDNQCGQIDSILEDTKSSIDEYKRWKFSVISEAVTKGLDRSVDLKDSGCKYLEKIPTHWQKVKVNHFAYFFNGDRTSRYPQPTDFVAEGVAFLNSSNLNGDVVDTSICKYITEEKYNSLSGAKLQKGDIVYCLRGSVGKCAINTNLERGTVASSLATIRPHDINGEYLLFCLLSDVAVRQTQVYMNGTCAANLSAENVSNYLIALPPHNEQDAIAKYLKQKCEAIDSLISEKNALVIELERYKRSLIFEAVTGKRKVV